MVAFRSVMKTAKLLVVILMLGIVPLRALAAVTIGFCAFGQHDAAAQAAALPDHGSPHEHGSTPHPHGNPESPCNTCAEHCASAPSAACTQPPLLPPFAVFERPALDTPFLLGFVPDRLDRPPLAL